MRSSLSTRAAAPLAASTSAGRISFHGRPAKKITYSPAASTRMPVPRSGCLAISRKGSSSSANAAMKSGQRSRPSRFWNHQASISGTASLSSSDGWICVMPMLSQRVAPFFVTPNSAVATSSITPTVYSGMARAISFCGGTWATRNIRPSASSMLRAWSTKRVPWSKPAEYMDNRPQPHSHSTASSSGRSKPMNQGRSRLSSGGRSMTVIVRLPRPAPRRPRRAGPHQGLPCPAAARRPRGAACRWGQRSGRAGSWRCLPRWGRGLPADSRTRGARSARPTWTRSPRSRRSAPAPRAAGPTAQRRHRASDRACARRP
mmetsp:Transcript_37511/g.87372  ORF Transcript_37511/g.87372 Transcript_37511/m.87372 type:complete len:317 (+) Transcript_37511:1514-2464(+)